MPSYVAFKSIGAVEYHNFPDFFQRSNLTAQSVTCVGEECMKMTGNKSLPSEFIIDDENADKVIL